MQENLLVAKKVKVRIKIGTVPFLGYVKVPPPVTRVSDILNSTDLFLPLNEASSLEPVTPGSLVLINKEEISYIQTLEDSPRKPGNFDITTIGQFRHVKIVLRDATIKVLGEIFIPFKSVNIANVINFSSFFINLKNVKIGGTREEYSYLAVSKSFVRSIESAGKDVSP